MGFGGAGCLLSATFAHKAVNCHREGEESGTEVRRRVEFAEREARRRRDQIYAVIEVHLHRYDAKTHRGPVQDSPADTALVAYNPRPRPSHHRTSSGVPSSSFPKSSAAASSGTDAASGAAGGRAGEGSGGESSETDWARALARNWASLGCTSGRTSGCVGCGIGSDETRGGSEIELEIEALRSDRG